MWGSGFTRTSTQENATHTALIHQPENDGASRSTIKHEENYKLTVRRKRLVYVILKLILGADWQS